MSYVFSSLRYFLAIFFLINALGNIGGLFSGTASQRVGSFFIILASSIIVYYAIYYESRASERRRKNKNKEEVSRPEKPVENINSSPSDLNTSSSKKLFLLPILLLFALVVFNYVDSTSRNDNSSDNSKFDLLENTDLTSYTSISHGFVIDFPGFPETETSTFDIEGMSIPYTQYSKDKNDGNIFYMAQVAQYPSELFDVRGAERDVLESSINGAAQSSNGTIASSSNDELFFGYPSASAKINVMIESESYAIYLQNFVKENDLYSIMTVGETEEKFNTFVNSFRFN